EITKVTMLLASLYVASHFGVLWACLGVGVAFTIHAAGAVLSVKLTDDVPFWRLIGGLVPQLIACLPMAGAVFGVRYALRNYGFEANAFTLALEILAGGIAYVPSAFIFAPTATKDFISVLKRVLAARRGDGDEDDEDED
ncbi:MAG: hypothetical protein JRH20_29045, partial [Deltaproteobacteria bacterium]|nr:hypothetical protein [Deltaproteobacteria bacterium]